MPTRLTSFHHFLPLLLAPHNRQFDLPDLPCRVPSEAPVEASSYSYEPPRQRPNPSATASTANSNDHLDDLASALSALLLPPTSASDPAAAFREYLLPCLDTYSICTLAVVHPNFHDTLRAPALFAGESVHVNFHDTNKPMVSARGRHIPPTVNPTTTDRFASFFALPALAHVQALDLMTPYIDQQLVDTIRGRMRLLTSLSVSKRGVCSIGGYVSPRVHLCKQPLVFELVQSLPNLRELLCHVDYICASTPLKKFLYSTKFELHTIHLVDIGYCHSKGLVSLFQDVLLPSLRVLTLVNFGRITLTSVYYILRACPNLQRLTLRLTALPPQDPEPLDVKVLRLEGHPAFAERPPGWSSKVCFDEYANSTDLHCFVPRRD